MKDIKHLLWLIKTMFVCLVNGEYDDARLSIALIKIHLTHKGKRIK